MIEIDTPHGTARVRLEGDDPAEGGAGGRGGAGLALVLGHGAGGGVNSTDLRAAAEAALALGFRVALVEQPYRVAGRRSPPPARTLDTAWVAVVEALAAGALAGFRLVVGGRSSGARVACRTAAHVQAAGVICLAFPLLPPGPARQGDASKSRLGELDAVPPTIPVLIVQGERDPFGMPPEAENRSVVPITGTHTLSSTKAVRSAVSPWLAVLASALG
ncbi:MAG TPA: alpha/beta family hydrolase [Solirubrobacteraceae bacterium]|nr:alpha/beta family hydrolase [Solirubrobacteraceae bacterium]